MDFLPVNGDIEEQFAVKAASRLEEISTNLGRVAVLHKELLEINRSVVTYIEESKKLFKAAKLDLASSDEGSHQLSKESP